MNRRLIVAVVWCLALASCSVALITKKPTPIIIAHTRPSHGRKKLTCPNPPNAPTNLLALNLNRRLVKVGLYWKAPDDGCGNDVSGYQVRVARVPITSANFNDPTVVCGVQYGLTPITSGVPACQ